jgi:hypothetical protein
MGRLRISLRHAMVAVAISAIVLTAMIGVHKRVLALLRLRQSYQSLASKYARDEAVSNLLLTKELKSLAEVDEHNRQRLERARGLGLDAEMLDHVARSTRGLHDQVASYVEQEQEILKYYAFLKRKYLNAGRTPWREIPADPPMPVAKKPLFERAR